MNIQQRVSQQFPSLFVTLVSVLIGLAFADLVSEAHARMKLWPLDLETGLTWAQIVAITTSAMAAWIVYSHIGISRTAVAKLSDTLVAFLVPVPLVLMVGMTGRSPTWPWFYGGGIYLLIAVTTTVWQVALAVREADLKPFRQLLKPFGLIGILMMGAPGYVALGWFDQHGLMTPEMKLAAAAAASPIAVFCAWVFVRDWRAAVAASSPPEPA